MKKILVLIIVLLPFFAQPHIARAIALDCEANPGDYSCTCFGDVGEAYAETGSFEDVSATTADECFSDCAAADATSYQFDSCGSDGNATTTGQQSLVSTTTSTSATTTVDSSAIIPNLNIPIPGLDLTGAVTVDSATGTASSNLLGLYVAAVYRYLITATALVAVVMLMVGGVGFATARGNAKAVDKARSRITNAIIGLILVLAAYDIAFFIDPNTVQFNALQFQSISTIALESEGTEVDDLSGVAPSADAIAAGNLVTISGDHLINATSDGSNYINADVLTKLNDAVDKYYTLTGKNVYVSSASRTLTKQAELFYDKCLVNGGKCSPSTCDVTATKYYKSPVLSYSNGIYTLTGALAGQTNRTTVVTQLAANGKAQYCPHTSNVAVDIWPEGSGNYRANVQDIQNLMTVMTDNKFCRLSSEAWHYELDSVKVDKSSCSTDNNSTTVKGHSTAGCTKYDFKNFCCVLADIQATTTPTMCTN